MQQAHYSEVILLLLVEKHDWQPASPGSVQKEIGNTRKIVFATFCDRGRYLALQFGFDDPFDIDCRGINPPDAAADFDAKTLKWATEAKI